MTVPVEPHTFALLIDYSTNEFHYLARAIGRSVADRITDAYSAGPTSNRSSVERANRFGIGARGVFSDEHHRQTFLHRERHSVFSHFQKFIECPCFRVEANRR